MNSHHSYTEILRDLDKKKVTNISKRFSEINHTNFKLHILVYYLLSWSDENSSKEKNLQGKFDGLTNIFIHCLKELEWREDEALFYQLVCYTLKEIRRKSKIKIEINNVLRKLEELLENIPVGEDSFEEFFNSIMRMTWELYIQEARERIQNYNPPIYSDYEYTLSYGYQESYKNYDIEFKLERLDEYISLYESFQKDSDSFFKLIKKKKYNVDFSIKDYLNYLFKKGEIERTNQILTILKNSTFKKAKQNDENLELILYLLEISYEIKNFNAANHFLNLLIESYFHESLLKIIHYSKLLKVYSRDLKDKVNEHTLSLMDSINSTLHIVIIKKIKSNFNYKKYLLNLYRTSKEERIYSKGSYKSFLRLKKSKGKEDYELAEEETYYNDYIRSKSEFKLVLYLYLSHFYPHRKLFLRILSYKYDELLPFFLDIQDKKGIVGVLRNYIERSLYVNDKVFTGILN